MNDAEMAQAEAEYRQEREYEFIPEMDQPSPYSFCDNYTSHDNHSYRALNGNVYICDGISQDEINEMNERANELCAHGMSASLCADPISHYPRDM